MDFPPELLVFVVWAVLALLGRKANQQGQQKRQQRQRQGEAPGTRQRAKGKPQTFDDLLAEMREQLEEAKRAEARERGADRQLPSAEEVEERESLEEEPVVVSLEAPVIIEERPVVDSDLEAQRLIAARLRDAEKRNRAWRLEDHKKFDARIRAPQPEPRLPRKHVRDLKRAVIWREILGKPVSLRD